MIFFRSTLLLLFFAIGSLICALPIASWAQSSIGTEETSDTINFGQVIIGDSTFHPITFHNNDTIDKGFIFTISGHTTSVAQLNGTKVPAGGSLVLLLNYKADTMATFDSITFTFPSDTTITFYLIGNGIPPPPLDDSLRIPNLSANTGDQFVLPIILDSLTRDSSKLASLHQFQALLTFDPTLMLPLDTVHLTAVGYDQLDSRGMFTYVLTGSYSGQRTGDTLLKIPFIATLGDSRSTPVILSSWSWQGNDRSNSPLTTTVTSGIFQTANIWSHDGWDRLLNPNSDSLKLSIYPNPFTSKAIATITSSSPISSLTIYDINGNWVNDLTGSITNSTVSINAATDLPAAGNYFFLRLIASGHAITKTIIRF